MGTTLRTRPLASLPTAKLSTGCPQLDWTLGGGLPCGSLTEVVGEAAASKTQLCLQLLLSVQLPHEYGGLEGSAVYMYTEGEPAMKRLQQLARFLPLRYPPEALQGLPDPAANIFIEKSIGTGAELLGRLQRLRRLLERQRCVAVAANHSGSSSSTAPGGSGGSGVRPVKLLVVDSVAHVFRDMGNSVGVAQLAGRTELLFRISALLRRYADEFGLAVLLVNQVVDCVTAATRSGTVLAAEHSVTARQAALTGGLRLLSLGREVAPALGLAWANCVNNRVFLARCAGPDGATPALFHGAPSPAAQAAAEQAAGSGGAGGGTVAAPALRRMQVLFSPHLPQEECYYIVEATGVRGLHPDELAQHDAAATAAAAAAWQQQQQWEQEQARQAWDREAWSEQQQQPQHQAPMQQGQGWQQQHQPLQQQPPMQQGQGWQQQQQQPLQQPPMQQGQGGQSHEQGQGAKRHQQGLPGQAWQHGQPQQQVYAPLADGGARWQQPAHGQAGTQHQQQHGWHEQQHHKQHQWNQRASGPPHGQQPQPWQQHQQQHHQHWQQEPGPHAQGQQQQQRQPMQQEQWGPHPGRQQQGSHEQHTGGTSGAGGCFPQPAGMGQQPAVQRQPLQQQQRQQQPGCW